MYRIKRMRTIFSLIGILALLAVQFGGIIPAAADHTPDPTTVTIAGSLQSELGCAGDWHPECAVTHLAYDAGDDVWQGTCSPSRPAAMNTKLPSTIAGQKTTAPTPNRMAQTSPSTWPPTPHVKFYYDHKSHWVTDNVNSVIATVPGSFQSELGCSGDWAPDCLRSWLQDPDGDGIYSFSTSAIPAGSYEAKVAYNETWDVNYGAGRRAKRPQHPLQRRPQPDHDLPLRPGDPRAGHLRRGRVGAGR